MITLLLESYRSHTSCAVVISHIFTCTCVSLADDTVRQEVCGESTEPSCPGVPQEQNRRDAPTAPSQTTGRQELQLYHAYPHASQEGP